MTATAPMLEFSGAILACRAVLTTAGTSGDAAISVFAEVQG
jgi:hypothetical protein